MTAILYLALSKWYQSTSRPAWSKEGSKHADPVAYDRGLSLVLLTAPSVVYLAGRMSLETVKGLMLIATILWFVHRAWHF